MKTMCVREIRKIRTSELLFFFMFIFDISFNIGTKMSHQLAVRPRLTQNRRSLYALNHIFTHRSSTPSTVLAFLWHGGSGACTAASQQEGHGFDSCMERCWLWGAGFPQTFSAQVRYLPGLSVWSLYVLPAFTRGFLH